MVIQHNRAPVGALICYKFEHQDGPEFLAFAQSGHKPEVSGNLKSLELGPGWRMAEAYSQLLEDKYGAGESKFELIGSGPLDISKIDEFYGIAKTNDYGVFILEGDQLNLIDDVADFKF